MEDQRYNSTRNMADPKAFTMPTTVEGPALTRSRLLDLPADIQRIIYELVVIEVEPIKPRCILQLGWNWTDFEPGITKTCKYLRSDTLRLYYGSNTFDCGWDAGCAIHFIRSLGTNRQAMLRRVYIHLDRPDGRKGYKYDIPPYNQRQKYIVKSRGGYETRDSMVDILDGIYGVLRWGKASPCLKPGVLYVNVLLEDGTREWDNEMDMGGHPVTEKMASGKDLWRFPVRQWR